MSPLEETPEPELPARPTRARLRGTDLIGEGSASCLHRVKILLVLVALVPDVCQQRLALVPGCDQRALLRDQLVACGSLLGGLLCEYGGDLLDFLLGRRGFAPGDTHRVPHAFDLVDDAAVLVSDLAEVVDLLDQVVQARHLQQDLELGRLPGLVKLDEPLLEAGLCELVLRDQEFEPARLLLVLRLEAG